jgi:hypothetical protein
MVAAAMGQPITVIEKRGERNDIVRFELNRSLTGMGHERYRADQEIQGNRPPDELARLLFAHGGVEAVHVYSNVVTVDLAPGAKSDGLADIVHSLFVHYDHDEAAPEPAPEPTAEAADGAPTSEGVTEASE